MNFSREIIGGNMTGIQSIQNILIFHINNPPDVCNNCGLYHRSTYHCLIFPSPFRRDPQDIGCESTFFLKELINGL